MLTFVDALSLLNKGYWLRRCSWKKGNYIFKNIMLNKFNLVDDNDNINLQDEYYTITNDDIFSQDWTHK